MTTIAASIEHCCMAADTLSVGGNTVVSRRHTKIHRVNGCLVGLSGLVTDGLLFLQWFETHDLDKRPSLSEDFAAMVLSRKGLFRYFDECVPLTAPDIRYYAIGSGWEWAYAAMDFGRSPAQAVRYAMTRDVSTGGSVRVFRL